VLFCRGLADALPCFKQPEKDRLLENPLTVMTEEEVFLCPLDGSIGVKGALSKMQ
jgi:hypothetical protein